VISYILSGQEIFLSFHHPAIQNYFQAGANHPLAPVNLNSVIRVTSQITGLVAGKNRQVEVWSTGKGLILKVNGFRDFYITLAGREIVPATLPTEVKGLEQEVVLGPALVLALALAGKWCVHCSAALYKEKGILFLGESGFGKSTLASSLCRNAGRDWKLAADDILPVTLGIDNLTGWPHYPQLKISTQDQPGNFLPEQVPVSNAFILKPVPGQIKIRVMDLNETTQALISNTAGTRLFTPELLKEHLEFCASAAQKIKVYELTYPHDRNRLREVMDQIVETISE
jgi:hypothetical protein